MQTSPFRHVHAFLPIEVNEEFSCGYERRKGEVSQILCRGVNVDKGSRDFMFALPDCLTICNQRANQNAFLRRVFCRSRPLSSTPFHLMLSMDKQRVLSMLLHSCDVSHPAKRWQLHSQWTTRWEIGLFVDICKKVVARCITITITRCMEEFFKQGDKEQEQGLDFSPLCDRHNTMVPQSQIGNGK